MTVETCIWCEWMPLAHDFYGGKFDKVLSTALEMSVGLYYTRYRTPEGFRAWRLYACSDNAEVINQFRNLVDDKVWIKDWSPLPTNEAVPNNVMDLIAGSKSEYFGNRLAGYYSAAVLNKKLADLLVTKQAKYLQTTYPISAEVDETWLRELGALTRGFGFGSEIRVGDIIIGKQSSFLKFVVRIFDDAKLGTFKLEAMEQYNIADWEESTQETFLKSKEFLENPQSIINQISKL